MNPFPRIPDPNERAALTGKQIAWIAISVAVPVLAFLPYLPAWIPLLAVAAIAGRWYIAAQRLPLPPRPMRLALTLGCALAIFTSFGTYFGRDPGSALLVVMTGLKLLETRNRRDGILAVFLGYFLLAVLFFHSQEIPVALYALAAVWLLIGTLLSLRDDAANSRRRLGSAGALLVQSLPVMLLLFYLFPRLPGALWGIPSDRTTGVTGLSETMAPGSISELLRSDAVAFRVDFTADPPPAALRYWRGPVLSQYDGRTWRPQRVPLGDRPFPVIAATEPIAYTLTLEPSSGRWLPALDLPLAPPTGAIQMRDLDIVLPGPPRGTRDFSLQSLTGYRFEPELGMARRAQFLELPQDAAPRARLLARRWSQTNGGDPGAVVAAALTMFREQPFVYTLSPPTLAGDPVDEFLFETRRGFCEHYASTFVVLMRAAGIPARVVTGYQGGELNPLGGYLIVRQSDAHAWAEVWFEERGWVRIDPTAAVAPERIDRGISAALAGDPAVPAYLRRGELSQLRLRLALAWDTTNYYWNAWVLAFNPDRQREFLSRLGFQAIDFKTMIAMMVIGVAGLLTAFWSWAAVRGKPHRDDPAIIAYERLCAKLADAGITRRPGEAPSDFARRVATERPDLGPETARLVTLYCAIRYGHEPLPGLLRELDSGVRKLRTTSSTGER